MSAIWRKLNTKERMNADALTKCIEEIYKNKNKKKGKLKSPMSRNSKTWEKYKVFEGEEYKVFEGEEYKRSRCNER